MKIIDNSKITGLLFLGKVLPVEKYSINTNKLSVRFTDDRVVICGNETLFSNEDNVRYEIYISYKKCLYVVLKERIDIYRGIIGVRPRKISVRSQKTIWGSCSSKGSLSFNYRLMMAPLKAIDYVVVHELCHMVHMNHSSIYWRLVESIIPDYRDIKKWLDDNGSTLNFYYPDV
ncbi:M48 family metallopeptidase [Clostridium sp. LBM24168]